MSGVVDGCPEYSGSTEEGGTILERGRRDRKRCLGFRDGVGFSQVCKRKRVVPIEGTVLGKVWSVRQHGLFEGTEAVPARAGT